MKRYIQFFLLAFTLAVFAASFAVSAENPPGSENPVINGAAPETTTPPGPSVTLIDDVGRLSLCVNFATGAWTWNILKGTGAGMVFVGTGKVLYMNGPWTVIYSTATLAMSGVYDPINRRANAGLRYNGGGTLVGSTTPPITSALYDSNTGVVGVTTECGAPPPDFQHQDAPLPEAGILAGSSVSESAPVPPSVDLLDNQDRSEACFDFSTGNFFWNILSGPGAGNSYSGTGTVLYLYGPWSIMYSTATMAMQCVYNPILHQGVGALRVNNGGGEVQQKTIRAPDHVPSLLHQRGGVGPPAGLRARLPKPLNRL